MRQSDLQPLLPQLKPTPTQAVAIDGDCLYIQPLELNASVEERRVHQLTMILSDAQNSSPSARRLSARLATIVPRQRTRVPPRLISRSLVSEPGSSIIGWQNDFFANYYKASDCPMRENCGETNLAGFLTCAGRLSKGRGNFMFDPSYIAGEDCEFYGNLGAATDEPGELIHGHRGSKGELKFLSGISYVRTDATINSANDVSEFGRQSIFTKPSDMLQQSPASSQELKALESQNALLLSTRLSQNVPAGGLSIVATSMRGAPGANLWTTKCPGISKTTTSAADKKTEMQHNIEYLKKRQVG